MEEFVPFPQYYFGLNALLLFHRLMSTNTYDSVLAETNTDNHGIDIITMHLNFPFLWGH